jgi:hypothetical protein
MKRREQAENLNMMVFSKVLDPRLEVCLAFCQIQLVVLVVCEFEPQLLASSSLYAVSGIKSSRR